MMHLIFYQGGNTVVMCGFENIPDHHTTTHIAWASDTLISNQNVCAMCAMEWIGTVDTLERRVRE